MTAVVWVSIFSSAVAAQPAAPQATAVPDSVSHTDQVLVRWQTRGNAPETLVGQTAALRAAGGQPDLAYARQTAAGSSVYKLPAPLGNGAEQTLAQLRATPGVASVEPDYWLTPTADPTSDTYSGNLWGLLGPANGSTYGINAVGAWPTTMGSDVAVAVIDTGLRFDHPDLAGQTYATQPGYDLIVDDGTGNDAGSPYFQPGRDPDPTDPGDWCTGHNNSTWHGTHVAGTIAALKDNSLGVFGGAPDVKIEPVRVLGTCGGYDSDVADAIRWASGDAFVPTVPGALPATYLPVNIHAGDVRALNLSLGGSATCPAGSDMAEAIAYARGQGKVVVTAAGNANIDAGLFMPANCPGSFTVAAIGQTGKKASFSNYGTKAHPVVEIAAPGVAILSTLNAGTTTANPYVDGDESICGTIGATAHCAYAYYSGTSMATPHVALTAALVASVNPDLTPDEIEQILMTTAHPFAADTTRKGCTHNYPLHCGVGIVNAADAVAAASATLPTGGPDVAPPVASISYPQALAGGVTLHVSWPAATNATGAVSYELQRNVNNGGWTNVTLGAPTDLAVDVSLAPGAAQDLRLRATDDTGPSAWIHQAQGSTSLAPYQENQKPPLSYVGTLKRVALAGASGGYVKRSGAAGRSVTLVFNGTSAAWVSTLGPNRGIAEISLDDVSQGQVDLYNATLQPAQVVWAPSGALSPGAHTLKVTVTGTANALSTKTRVDIDAFLTY